MAKVMKDSGVEWIGEIPNDWETIRLKYGTSILSGYPFESSKFSNKNGFPLIRIRDITSGMIETFYDGEFDDSYIVDDGDILVGMDGDFNVREWSAGKALLNQRCCRVNVKASLYSKYVYYCLPLLLQRINQLTYATTVKHLSTIDILEARIPNITAVEQKRIADYLDKECARIDEVIEKTRASIEEYKKLKQSAITQAVTKGIRPDREMKDSGIEWLGSIPSDWRIEKGKRLFYETSGRSEDGSEELLTVSQYTGVTPRSQKTVNMFEAVSLEGYKICEIGDIAANTMWLWAGAIGVSKYRGVISPSYNIYRQRGRVYIDSFLDYLLRNVLLVEHFESLSTGIRASRLRLYPQQFLSIFYPVPSIVEQEEIVMYLDDKINELDKLIDKKEGLLGELEEYKKSLIFEYVTGKKEV